MILKLDDGGRRRNMEKSQESKRIIISMSVLYSGKVNRDYDSIQNST